MNRVENTVIFTVGTRKLGIFDKIYALMREKHWDEALFELTDNETGEIRSRYSEDLNHACYILGDIYFHCEQFPKALRAFQMSLSFQNDDYQAIWAIAGCYAKLGNHKFAERQYRRALSYGVEMDVISYDLGCELFDQEEYEEAVECFGKIITSNSELREKIKKNIELAKSKINNGR